MRPTPISSTLVAANAGDVAPIASAYLEILLGGCDHRERRDLAVVAARWPRAAFNVTHG